jgi:hypothetical protein
MRFDDLACPVAAVSGSGRHRLDGTTSQPQPGRPHRYASHLPDTEPVDDQTALPESCELIVVVY